MRSLKPLALAYGQFAWFLFGGALAISALSVAIAWLLQSWLGQADAVIWGALAGIPLLMLLGWFASNTRRIHQLHRYWGLTFLALFTLVWTSGTLSYYRAELDMGSWSLQSVTPLAGGTENSSKVVGTSLAALPRVQQHLAQHAAEAQTWYIELPTARKPVFVLHWSQPDYRLYQQVLNMQAQPITAITPASEAHKQQLGSWFFQMHYTLFGILGAMSRYVVAFAAGFLLVICFSGVRLWWQQRALVYQHQKVHQHPKLLRFHLWGGLAVLPVVLLVASTALVTMIWQINPAPLQALYGQQSNQFYQTLFPWQSFKPATAVVNTPPDLARILASHQQFVVGKIQVQQPFADTSEVWLTQDAASQVSNQLAVKRYDRLGQPIASEEPYHSVAMQVRSVSYGLHQALFAPPSLRLLLACCSALLLVVMWLGLRSWQVRRQLAWYWRLGFSCILPGLPLCMLFLVPFELLLANWSYADWSQPDFALGYAEILAWFLLAYAICRALGFWHFGITQSANKNHEP